MANIDKPVIQFPHGMNPRNPRPVQGDEIMRQIESKLGDKWMQVKLGRSFIIYRDNGDGRKIVAQSSSFINAVSQATGLAIVQIVPTKK